MKIILQTLCGCSQVLFDEPDIVMDTPRYIAVLLPQKVSVLGCSHPENNGQFSRVRNFDFFERAGQNTLIYRERSEI